MKFLVVRFSSIGDIVLCSPVIRCLKQQLPDAQIHFATKAAYASLLEHNPHVDGVHILKDDWSSFVHALKAQRFDHIIDLHNNLRSRRLSMSIGVKRSVFNKINAAKWLRVNLKIDRLPRRHIVDRYLDTVSHLGVKNDGGGLELHLPEYIDATPLEKLPSDFHCFAIGGQHDTKKLPQDSIGKLLDKIKGHVVLIGGPEDAESGKNLAEGREHVTNLCGALSMLQSALAIRMSAAVITHDTGMMHIAAAFGKDVLSIWGNTIPEFGMYPYRAGKRSEMFEVHDLGCRPCSKIGFDKCPKGHFKCMRSQDLDAIGRSASMLFREEHGNNDTHQ